LQNNQKLAVAIAAILGSCAGMSRAATATDTDTSGALEEVTVTAQRRSQNLQDVPITMQALTGVQLTELSITNFDDVVKYLPNVTIGSNGPGQADLFMRGLSAA